MNHDAPRRVFSRKAVAWIVGISVVSFLIAFVMAAYGEKLGGPRSARADAFSYSAIGHRALTVFLGRAGQDVTLRRDRRFLGFGPRVPLLAIEPVMGWEDGEESLIDLQYLAGEAEAPLIVVLPKWIGVPDTGGRFVAEVLPAPAEQVEGVLNAALFFQEIDDAAILRAPIDLDRCGSLWGVEYSAEIGAPQVLAPHENLTPLVECSGGTLIGRFGDEDAWPQVYVVADPDLLNNHGLPRAEHPLIVLGFLEHLSSTGVVVDETLHGFSRDSSLIAELLGFPLVVVVLHGLLVLGLVVWAGAARFGRPERSTADADRSGGRKLLVENAAQLIALGDHASGTLQRYYNQTLRAVGAHYFFPQDSQLDNLQADLQSISRARGSRVDLGRIRRRVVDLRPGAGAPERAVRIAGSLYGWRQEMTDGPRTHS